MPEYEKEDITPYLCRERLEDEDYALLAAQTGLGRSGVEQLWEDGCREELLELQERFFAPVEYDCSPSFLVCRHERLVSAEKEKRFFVVQDGDILITFSGHFLGWRSGHAGIVTDAAGGTTVEAAAAGIPSGTGRLEDWAEYPTVAVLRLRDADAEERGRIADYAAGQLVDIPYELFSFCDRSGDGEAPDGTQCAHLVWTAYFHFGYDLAEQETAVVTPRDLYRSGLLEVVQTYGLGLLR